MLKFLLSSVCWVISLSFSMVSIMGEGIFLTISGLNSYYLSVTPGILSEDFFLLLPEGRALRVTVEMIIGIISI